MSALVYNDNMRRISLSRTQHPQKQPHERQIGLCMLDDMLEHCEGAALPLYQSFLPAMINYITDSNPSVRQAAVFGIGVCAQFGGPAMASIIPGMLPFNNSRLFPKLGAQVYFSLLRYTPTIGQRHQTP